jgi:hypothetical protein
MQTFDGNLDHVDWSSFYVALDALGPRPIDDPSVDEVLARYGVPRAAGFVGHQRNGFLTFVRHFSSEEQRRYVTRTSERHQRFWAYRSAGVSCIHPGDTPF